MQVGQQPACGGGSTALERSTFSLLLLFPGPEEFYRTVSTPCPGMRLFLSVALAWLLISQGAGG